MGEMTGRTRQRLADILAALGALAVLGGTIYLLVRLVSDAKLVQVQNHAGLGIIRELGAIGWVVLALAGGLALLGAWLLARRGVGTRAEEEHRRAAEERAAEAEERARAAEERAEEAEQRAGAAQARGEEAEAEVEKARRKLHTSEVARAGAERSRRVEREWNRELRDQLGRLYRERRGQTDIDDVRTLVLHTAVSLLDAEKGLLLERPDGHDGLSVCRAEGFDHDPADARLVRRFAGEVLARDTILREDALDEDPQATEADREVDNLVAIPLYIADDFAGVVVAANRDGGFHEHDDEVLLALGNHAGAVLENSRLQADLRSSYLGSVRMLAEAIEAKDASLRGHAEDVVRYVMAVAEAMELDADQRERLLFGSLLHDVGKIGISERILSKPGPLTPEERSAIELHPRIGFRLVDQVPGLRGVGLAVLHHHERWDGTGYPGGLHAEEIPLEGRIVAVADAFDAMTTDRPYRGRMPVDEACAELERGAGSQFDPDVVGLFVEAVRHQPPDEEAPGALAAALGDPELAHRTGPTQPHGLVGSAAAALSDPLTLLYGRRWFDAALRAAGPAAQLRAEPFTVALVELAGLDELNRAEGLEGGDAALVAVAQAASRVAAHLRGSACRFSGARLALLLPGPGSSVDVALLELRRELEPLRAEPRFGAAAWQPGEEGRDVLARVRDALAVQPAGL